jgi:hypothetical protein
LVGWREGCVETCVAFGVLVERCEV